MEMQDGIFQPQPALTIGVGAPVYDPVSKSIIGITARTASDGVVVSTQKLMKLFPELKSR